MSYFSDNGETKPQEQNTSQEDYVKQLVETKGDQWQDPQAMAKGYLESQKFIEDLKRQTDELREDLDKKAYIEDVLKTLPGQKATPPAGTDEENKSGSKEENTTPGLDEESVKSLIDGRLTERQVEELKTKNLSEVDKRLEELHGTEAKEVVSKRAEELGMDKDSLKQIAEKSPAAFLRLIGEETPSRTNPVTGGSVNTSSSFLNGDKKRNSSYYQDLRRSNPKLYHSAKTQKQMFEDAKSMGADFYNT